MNNDIVRVWGTADNISLELEFKEGRWVQSLPPDLTDGQYAVSLYAQNRGGDIGMWTGMLYVSQGLSCIHLKKERFSFWLKPERFTVSLIKECGEHGQPVKA